VDTLILGCTHYALIKNQIRKIVGSPINLIGAEEFVAQQIKQSVSMRMPDQFAVECLTTSEPLFFDLKAQQLTELSLPAAQLVQLSETAFSSWEASPAEDGVSF
jgi:glutamate racemase